MSKRGCIKKDKVTYILLFVYCLLEWRGGRGCMMKRVSPEGGDNTKINVVVRRPCSKHPL